MKRASEKKSIGKTKGAASQEAAFSFDPSHSLENERHEMFCVEFSVTRNRVRSYLNQYPDSSYFAAAASANALLKDPKIAARADHLTKERMEQVKMSSDEVLVRLSDAARLDPSDLFRPDGSMIPVHEMPPEVRLCIEKIEYDEITIGEGDNKKTIGRTAKVQVMSKKAALELLGKHHKLFADRVEHTGPNGIPLPTEITINFVEKK